MNTLASTVADLIISMISNNLYEKKITLFKKIKLFIFRKRLTQNIQKYRNNHDGSILTTDTFEAFFINYHIIDKIYAHISGKGLFIPKKNYIEKLVSLYENQQRRNTLDTFENRNILFDFLYFLYDTMEIFIRNELTANERHLLYTTLSSKEEIIQFVDTCKNEISRSLQQVQNDLHELKVKNSFHSILDSFVFNNIESANPFHYSNKEMYNIYGRDHQLELLRDFITDTANFSFCVITGPGGIGKSKLAYTFTQQQATWNTEWKTYFINEAALSDLAKCSSWNHCSNTLLIVDYAGISLDLLHNCFVSIVKHENNFKYKLRIILLDRVGMKKSICPTTNEVTVDYPNWYKCVINPQRGDFYTDSEYISRFLFSEFIELNGLSKDDYINLINDYYSATSKNKYSAEKPLNSALSPDQITDIVDFSYRCSNSLTNSRPIYIMLATDAVINGRDISNWDTSQMMRYIYERDRRHWIDIVHDYNILQSLEYALIYATIFGEWTLSRSFKIADIDICRDIEKHLQNPHTNGPVNDWLLQMCEFSTIENIPHKMKAYEPDIVGEFYVLNQLNNSPSSFTDWCDLIFDNLSRSKSFLERAYQDYTNTSLNQLLITILLTLTKKINRNDIDKGEYMVKLWELFLSETIYKDQKGTSLSNILKLCKKLFCQSQYIDETYIRLFFINPSEHSNTWREQRLPEIKQLYRKWPESSIIVTSYVDILGCMSSWYYRNGNLQKGNTYSKALNHVMQNYHNLDAIIIKYIDALGNIISGHYYMNDDTNIEAEIDDNFKLETIVDGLQTESHAIAYVDAIKKVLIQQSKYTADSKILKSLTPFCQHINKWINNEHWYTFRWNLGSIIPFAIILLYTYIKPLSAYQLVDVYCNIINNYIYTQYKIPNLIVSHYSRGIDKLISSGVVPEEICAILYNI